MKTGDVLFDSYKVLTCSCNRYRRGSYLHTRCRCCMSILQENPCIDNCCRRGLKQGNPFRQHNCNRAQSQCIGSFHKRPLLHNQRCPCRYSLEETCCKLKLTSQSKFLLPSSWKHRNSPAIAVITKRSIASAVGIPVARAALGENAALAVIAFWLLWTTVIIGIAIATRLYWDGGQSKAQMSSEWEGFLPESTALEAVA